MTLLYEIQSVLIFTMGFFFWTTQVPYMIWGPKWSPPLKTGAPTLDTQTFASGWNITNWVFLSLLHSAPQTALNIDVTLSSVLYYPRHIVFIMLTAFVYLGYYMLLYFMMGPNAPPIYPTNNFFTNKILATLITISLFIYLPLQFMSMVCCSRYKLRKRFKYMKLANN